MIRTSAKDKSLKNLTVHQAHVLGYIRRHNACSRLEIGHHFDWRPPSVSKILKPLVARGILLAASSYDPAHERRRAYLRINPDLACAIGAKLGFTTTSLALVGLDGQIIERGPVRFNLQRSPEEILETLQADILALMESRRDLNIVGAGNAFAGVINDRGEASRGFPETTYWERVPVTQVLGKTVKGILDVRNDNVCGLLGELRYGSALGGRNLLYLNMIEGISLALLINGRIYSGHNNNSGEFGHIRVIPDGPFCHCGSSGCLESVASSWAIIKQMKELIHSGISLKLGTVTDENEITLETISRAAQEGVPLARNLMSKAGEFIGSLLAMTANIMDPEKVILGGILSQREIHQTLIDQLEESFQRGLYTRPTRVRLEPSRFGMDAHLVGGASLVFERYIPAYPLQLDPLPAQAEA